MSLNVQKTDLTTTSIRKNAGKWPKFQSFGGNSDKSGNIFTNNLQKSELVKPMDPDVLKDLLLKDRPKPQTLPYIVRVDEDGNPINERPKPQTLPSITVFDEDGNPIRDNKGKMELL